MINAPTNTTETPISGMVGWWQGDDNAVDIINNQNGILFGTNNFTAGKVKDAFNFDGIINHVTIPYITNHSATNFTIEGWINPADVSRTQPLVEFSDSTGYVGVHIWLSVKGYTTTAVPGDLYFNFREGSSQYIRADHVMQSTNNIIKSNQWQHIAATYDKSSGIGSMYLNGSLVMSSNLGIFTPMTAYPILLGHRSATSAEGLSGLLYKGKIDELSLYNRALTPTEISAIYTCGSIGKSNIVINAPTNTTETPISGMVGWWRGEGNADDFLLSNPGTLSNGVTFSKGMVGQAFHFNGINQAVIISNSPSLNFGSNADFSIEAWIQVNTNQNKTILSIVDKRLAPDLFKGFPSEATVGYALSLYEGKLCFQLADAPLAPYNYDNYIAYSTQLNDGVFHHIAVTVNRGTSPQGHLYVDGKIVLVFVPNTSLGDLSNDEPLRIGMHATPGYDSFFSGMIDELSIYNRALTQADIQSIYAAKSSGKAQQLPEISDGIPSYWREKYFGSNYWNNLQASAVADPDQDGLNNYQEYLAGSNPLLMNTIDSRPFWFNTFAGSVTGDGNSYRTISQFRTPHAVKQDPEGRLWITEWTGTDYNTPLPGAHRIRIIDTNGFVTTLTGGSSSGFQDGDLASARFSCPSSVAFDSQGNAFVTDIGNYRIRKISTTGIVSTFAGTVRGFQDGPGNQAQFDIIYGIAIDNADNLYVTDFGNFRIRKITPQGIVSTFAGSSRGFVDGDRNTAKFGTPNDLAFSSNGDLFVSDWSNFAIRKIDKTGTVSTFASGIYYPETVAVDKAANVIVTSVRTMHKFSSNGKLAWSYSFPAGYQDGVIDSAKVGHFGGAPLILPNGNFLIADDVNNCLRQILIGSNPLVTIQPPGGLFVEAQAITVHSFASNAVIRYTLDNSMPDSNSPIFTTLTLKGPATVKVRAFVNDYPISEIISESYNRLYAINDDIPSWWREKYFGTNYLTDWRVAADADPDGDKVNNWGEFTGGTDPLNPLSTPIPGQIRLVPQISWNSKSNSWYQISKRPNLTSTNWAIVLPAVQATNASSSWIDLDASGQSGFYHIEEIQPPKP